MCLSPLCLFVWFGCAAAIAGWLFHAFGDEDIHTSRRHVACSLALGIALLMTFSHYSMLHLVWVLPLIEYLVGPLVYQSSLRAAARQAKPHG
jgi:hypothetical protein